VSRVFSGVLGVLATLLLATALFPAQSHNRWVEWSNEPVPPSRFVDPTHGHSRLSLEANQWHVLPRQPFCS
jgi:hypothetical protein